MSIRVSNSVAAALLCASAVIRQPVLRPLGLRGESTPRPELACFASSCRLNLRPSVRDFLMNSLRCFVIALAGLFLAATPKTLGQGPPIGSWDVVISGKYQHGVAQISFADDGTLSGIVAFTFFGRSIPHTNHGFV